MIRLLNLIIFLSICLNQNFAKAQILGHYSENKFDLKGNVKELFYGNYYVIEKNGQYFKGEKINESFLDDYQKYYFNENGLIAKEESYKIDNSLRYSVTNSFDSFGKILSEKSSNGGYSKYQYNDDKLLVNTYLYDEDNNLLTFDNYRYNEKNQLIESNNGTTITKYIYNENGLLIKRENYDSKELKLKEYLNKKTKSKNWTEFKYNNNSIKIEEVVYRIDENGKTIKNVTNYFYDNYGNLILENVTIGKDENENYYSKFQKSYIYEYDNKGNWIKCIFFNDEKPITYIERILKYY